MLNVRLISISAVMLTLMFCAPLASAAPIVNGNIISGDGYVDQVDDPTHDVNQTFQSDGWDIQSVHFVMEAGSLYLGVHTLGDYDRDGTGAPQPNNTFFIMRILDNSGPNGPFHEFAVSSNASDIALFRITGWSWGFPVLAPVPAADWDAAINSDLELRISTAQLSGITPEIYFFGKLDDLWDWSDDRVEGAVTAPEPGSMALLAMGGIAALIRRRRK